MNVKVVIATTVSIAVYIALFITVCLYFAWTEASTGLMPVLLGVFNFFVFSFILGVCWNIFGD